jgi:outer membrane protein TolC
MKRLHILLIPLLWVAPAAAQTFPTPDYLRRLMFQPAMPTQVPGPEGLRDHVVDGKLRLTLEDAIRLTLANNTDVRIDHLQIDQSKFNLLHAYQPFDPTTVSSFNTSRSLSPSITILAGAPTASSLSQQAQFGYSQTFQTGTTANIQFSGNKFDTNSTFATFNPSIAASLGFTLTQPLLRNRGLFPNRVPIVIAQRSLKQTRANFEAQINDLISRAVDQYWAVVQARESLSVERSSLEQAEASYKRDKRALELGALPPLDIYRSESEVASRRVAVIQAEYALKQSEDMLRQTLGADLDPYIHAIDLELTQKAEPTGELLAMDAAQALEKASKARPELEALRQQLANNDTSIRLAHNSLLPDLSLTGFYTSNGRGGNQINTMTTPPTIISTGGLSDALHQVRGLDFPTYGFNLQLRLPIRNRAAQADLGNALVTKRRGLYLIRQEEQVIQLEVSNAVHQLEQAKLSMAAAKIAQDLAQKTLEAEQRKLELGATTVFFVLQAQTQFATAELSLLQAQIGYQRGVTAVDRATGTLLEHHNIKLAD